MEKSEKAKKINEYESFINETLKPDLKEIEDKIQLKNKDASNWHEVKNTVKMLNYHKKHVQENDLIVYNPLLELGDILNMEVYSKSIVKYADDVHVKIGCDCILQMDLDEATKYADIRLKIVDKHIDHLRKQAVQVKVNIKLVLLAINELEPIKNTKL